MAGCRQGGETSPQRCSAAALGNLSPFCMNAGPVSVAAASHRSSPTSAISLLALLVVSVCVCARACVCLFRGL